MSGNEEFIRSEINRKMRSEGPYFAPTAMFYGITTDIDEFPYRRYFRGRSDSSAPIVWDREPGYQAIVRTPGTVRMSDRQHGPPPLTDLCFQIPCSTILPCHKKRYASSTLANDGGCVYISP